MKKQIEETAETNSAAKVDVVKTPNSNYNKDKKTEDQESFKFYNVYRKATGISYGVSHKQWHFQHNKGYVISLPDLYQSVIVDTNRYRRNGKDLVLFTSGKWKAIKLENFQGFIKRTIRSGLKYFNVVKGKVKIFLPDSDIKSVIDDVLSEIEEFPDMKELGEINSTTKYDRVITESTIYYIKENGQIETAINHGQYFNRLALPDFKATTEDVILPTEIVDFFKTISNKEEEFYLYLQELAGFCMLYGFGSEPYIHMLVGKGKNGKSVFISFLRMLVGFNTCAIEYSDINPQNIERFAETFINLPTELEGNKLIPEGALKAITSGDPKEANPKYRNPITVIPIAKQVAAMNKLIPVLDASDGFWRRIQVLPFLLNLKKSDLKSPKYFDHLFGSNIEVLRQWAFQGLVRFLKNKSEFTKSNLITNATAKYRIDENATMRFLVDFRKEVIEDIEDFNKTNSVLVYEQLINLRRPRGTEGVYAFKFSALYKIYKVWCLENGYRSVNSKNFKDKIETEIFSTNWLMVSRIDNTDALEIDFYELINQSKIKEIEKLEVVKTPEIVYEKIEQEPQLQESLFNPDNLSEDVRDFYEKHLKD